MLLGVSLLVLVCAQITNAPASPLLSVQLRGAADVVNPPLIAGPENEFQIARLVFEVNSQHGWGPGRPWWRIDWPEAEEHFLGGVSRYTMIDSAADSVHVQLHDESLFDYPWLFVQQAGRWHLDDASALRLGEYLRRGGFLLADDIHGPGDWSVFTEVMQRVLPEYSIEDIESRDAVVSILYDVDQRVQIPGRRHIVNNDAQRGYQVQMPHSPHRWRGIRDANGHWIVAINFNMDMGDSWEHADDPYYPLTMTSMGYRLGMNYIIYAMTH